MRAKPFRMPAPVLPSPDLIYKIATVSAFAPALKTSRFDGMGIDLTDGYIHFSTAAQLSETLRLHFKGQQDLLLVAVRTKSLGEALRWEPSRGGDLFPHLYGDLPMSAISAVAALDVPADGIVTLPEWVR